MNNDLELLEYFIEMSEKQDEIIYRQKEIILRQEQIIEMYRNDKEFSDRKLDEDKAILKETEKELEDYRKQ